MKKNIAIMLMFLVMATLSACCSSEYEERLTVLQEENNDLRTQITEQIQTTVIEQVTLEENSINEQIVLEEIDSDESYQEQTVNGFAIWENFLNTRLESGSYEDLLEVVTCEFATEQHLLTVANKCVNMNHEENRRTLAKLIAEHSSATDAVMTALVNTDDTEIWYEVAFSNYSAEGAMMTLAEKALEIDTNTQYHLLEKKVSAVTYVLHSSKTTDSVLLKIADDTDHNVWKWIIEQGNPKGVEVLFKVAQNCVAMNQFPNYSQDWMKESQYEIAKLLVSHHLANADIMYELSNTNYYKVWELLAMSKESDERTLQTVAEKCVGSSREEQLSMMELLLVHPATTDDIVLKFLESDCKEVIVLVQEYLKR